MIFLLVFLSLLSLLVRLAVLVRGSLGSAVLLLLMFLLLLSVNLVEEGAVLLRQRAGVQPEPSQLELVQQQQFLSAYWRLVDDRPAAA